MIKSALAVAALYALRMLCAWTYSAQTFSVGQVLTASQMNQVETNIADHQHGVSGVFDQAATQADQETGTSVLLYVTPGRQQYHPSACKGWAKMDFSAGIVASYNVTSQSDDGNGTMTVSWNVDFSSVNYFACCAIQGDPGGSGATTYTQHVAHTSFAAGTTKFWNVRLSDWAGQDGNYMHAIAFGDQA